MVSTNKAVFDTYSLANDESRSFDSKIWYWDERSELSAQEFIDDFTADELDEMYSLIEERHFDNYNYNNRFVPHFDFTYNRNDTVSIIYDYLRLIVLDCICYNDFPALSFYSNQIEKILLADI